MYELSLCMKLTLKIKLLPSELQIATLKDTLIEANTACNEISNTAWDKRLFNQFKLHHACYHPIKNSFKLGAQMVVRCISKVADSYKLDKKSKRTFKQFGAITYDSRILTYNANYISLSTVNGRIKIPFICHNSKYLPFVKGEADLVLNKDKFYIFQTVEIPEEEVEDIEEFIGVDMGITDLAVTSEGKSYSAKWLTQYRIKQQKIRSSIQSKGTKGCKTLLKRLSGKERTTATIQNHTISKSIVLLAKKENKGISIEDLTNIRFTTKRRNKAFNTKMGSWNFGQLRSFLTYKSELHGVKLVVVKPHYTSQTCSSCNHIGKRTNKVFKCVNTNCVVDTIDADFNASKNISSLGGAINHPEKSTMFCSLHQ